MGVTFGEMMAEPFKRTGFWIFFAIMFLTASAELGAGRLGRYRADADRRHAGHSACWSMSRRSCLSCGILPARWSTAFPTWACCASARSPPRIGLYLLSTANSPVTALVAATLWAFGVCFMWPTMLAAVARRFPRSGPWGIGLIGFAGALAIYFVLPADRQDL